MEPWKERKGGKGGGKPNPAHWHYLLCDASCRQRGRVHVSPDISFHVLQLSAADFADTRASGTKLCRTLCITHTTIGLSGSDLRGFSESKTLHYGEKFLLFHSFYQELVPWVYVRADVDVCSLNL
jgi:hypothetical protein